MTENDKNLISLKEAAAISGYSADYVGQLIRAGKIPGKQVYVNVAWMTTAEAVLAYKNGETSSDKDKDKGLGGIAVRFKRQIGMEAQIMKLFFENFKSAKSLIIVLILSFLLLNLSIFYYINHKQTVRSLEENKQTEEFSY